MNMLRVLQTNMRSTAAYGQEVGRESATIMATTVVPIIIQVKDKFVLVSKHNTKAYRKSGVKVPCTLNVSVAWR
jgi:hypothetical protein